MRKLFVGVAVIASLAIVGVPAAMATPKGAFAVFAQCPIHAAGVDGCIYSPTTSGYISGALNGETLTKTAQKVPGGLAGLVECPKIKNIIERILCEGFFENGLTGVNAVTELAAPASTVYLNTAAEQLGEGTALHLPIKVKLENPLFGSECYIGSNSEPIVLNLTTGATTGGPTGKPGTQKGKEKGKILEISGISLVSNTFTAPKATGCGLLGVLDGLINEKIGLPSTKNTAVLSGSVEIANSEFVEESEE
jgi:hypothetical protein